MAKVVTKKERAVLGTLEPVPHVAAGASQKYPCGAKRKRKKKPTNTCFLSQNMYNKNTKNISTANSAKSRLDARIISTIWETRSTNEMKWL
jgi:hypothetical protein